MQVYVNSLLNWAWAGMSLGAFAWFLLAACRHQTRSWRATTGRAIALALALVSLFPCVSASDDAARLTLWTAEMGSGAASSVAPGTPQHANETLATLVRPLEILEASQTAASILISVALFLVGYTIASREVVSECLLPSCNGRGPPLAAIL